MMLTFVIQKCNPLIVSSFLSLLLICMQVGPYAWLTIVVVVVLVANFLGIYHGFSPFMSLVSKFGMLVTVRALAEYPPST